MAIDFLSYSVSYVSDTPKNIRERRAAVAYLANEDYEIKKYNWTEIVIKELESNDVAVKNRHYLVDDLYMYRKLSFWLRGDQTVKAFVEERYQKYPSISNAIAKLKKDGIFSFQDLPVKNLPDYSVISDTAEVEKRADKKGRCKL